MLDLTSDQTFFRWSLEQNVLLNCTNISSCQAYLFLCFAFFFLILSWKKMNYCCCCYIFTAPVVYTENTSTERQHDTTFLLVSCLAKARSINMGVGGTILHTAVATWVTPVTKESTNFKTILGDMWHRAISKYVWMFIARRLTPISYLLSLHDCWLKEVHDLKLLVRS